MCRACSPTLRTLLPKGLLRGRCACLGACNVRPGPGGCCWRSHALFLKWHRIRYVACTAAHDHVRSCQGRDLTLLYQVSTATSAQGDCSLCTPVGRGAVEGAVHRACCSQWQQIALAWEGRADGAGRRRSHAQHAWPPRHSMRERGMLAMGFALQQTKYGLQGGRGVTGARTCGPPHTACILPDKGSGAWAARGCTECGQQLLSCSGVSLSGCHVIVMAGCLRTAVCSPETALPLA